MAEIVMSAEEQALVLQRRLVHLAGAATALTRGLQLDDKQHARFGGLFAEQVQGIVGRLDQEDVDGALRLSVLELLLETEAEVTRLLTGAEPVADAGREGPVEQESESASAAGAPEQ